MNQHLFVRDSQGQYLPADPAFVIEQAKRHLALQFCYGTSLTSPSLAKDLVQLRLGEYEHEVFALLLLDNRHRVLQFTELFRGTIDGASVYPREVVKLTLRHNAAAVMFAHNHPLGTAEPSAADRHLTDRLKNALATVDVRVLDHFVVGAETVYSFAEHGLM